MIISIIICFILLANWFVTNSKIVRINIQPKPIPKSQMTTTEYYVFIPPLERDFEMRSCQFRYIELPQSLAAYEIRQ